MKAFQLILCAAISMLLASCAHYPTPYRDANGKVAYTTQVGGKAMHTINADGSMAYTGDYEISLQHTLQAATSLGMSYISYLGALAREITTRYEAGQITLQQRDAGLRAVETALISAQGKATTEGIGASLPENIHVGTIKPPGS